MVRRMVAAAAISLCAGLIYCGFGSASLDDFDSYNFARALAEFAPARFQPHPPGYVLYVWFGQAALAMAGDARLALVALSGVSAALVCGLAFLAAGTLFNSRVALVAVILMLPTPLLWLNAGKALSDAPALLSQMVCFLAIALAARRSWPAWLAGLLLGIAAGFRPQAVPGLTLACFLVWLWLGLNARQWLIAILATGLGALTWLTPTLAAFGWNVGAMLGYFAGATGFVAGQESLFATAVTVETILMRWQVVWQWGSQAVFGPLPEFMRAVLGLGALFLAIYGTVARRRHSAHPRRLAVALCWAWLIPQAILHVVFLNPELTRYALVLLPPAAILVAHGLDMLFHAYSTRDVRVPFGVSLVFAVVVGSQALPLAQVLHTVPAPPDQLAAAIQSRLTPDNTLIVARQSYNALAYHLRGWDVRFADAYSPDALAREVASTTAGYVVIADPESLQPGEAFVEIETLSFQRDAQVHAKHALVAANLYGRADALAARDFALPPDGIIHIGTPQDGKYVLNGWYRREGVGGVQARWMGSEGEASLRVLVPAGATRVAVRLLSFPPDQQLTVSCEGETLGQAAVPQAWVEASFDIPSRCIKIDRPAMFTLRPGRRSAPSGSGSSTDRRLLGVAVTMVQFTSR